MKARAKVPVEGQVALKTVYRVQKALERESLGLPKTALCVSRQRQSTSEPKLHSVPQDV